MKRGESQVHNMVDFNASLQGESHFMGIDFNNGDKGYNNPNGQYQQQEKIIEKPNSYNPNFGIDKENKSGNAAAGNEITFIDNLRNMGAGNIRLDT